MIVVTRGSDPRDELLRRKLAAALGAMLPPGDHVDPDRLFAHAANELPPDEALDVGRHLTLCDDGRCPALLRDAVAGIAAARDALYGARSEEHTDSSISLPHRQSARTFACDADLWETFEALAREEGCSTDWLVNEAMKAYARERPRSIAPVAPREVTFHHTPPPPLPRERNTPTLPRAYLPKAPPSSRRPPPSPPSVGAPRLAVVIEGVTYEVTKDRFVVGRGGPASDLAIDDPGVSRQHAFIEHAGDSYYLVDMGSTNGTEYQGQKIDRRRIAHGDRFRIGDHVLEFLLH